MSEKLEAGSIVEGKVVKIKPFGAIVAFKSKAQGLVHISQISDSFVQNIEDHLSVGDEVKVKVLSVDEANNKISLSIREAADKEQKPQKQTNFKPRLSDSAEDAETPPQKPPVLDFEDKMKDWIKQSNERQAGINKRNNRR